MNYYNYNSNEFYVNIEKKSIFRVNPIELMLLGESIASAEE